MSRPRGRPYAGLPRESHEFAHQFGHQLRAYRLQAALTQTELADRLAVDRSLISRIERGQRQPPSHLEFYERLREMVGWSEEGMAQLFAIRDAPTLLVGHQRGPKQLEITVDDVTVVVHADPGNTPKPSAKWWRRS